ncbi:MAG TPA: MBOAT family O-acyltransferase, partial [Puia sp.]
MLFNSLDFLVFFPLVTVLYFLLPHRFRWIHLLVASCVFYMFFIPAYILILLFTVTLDYFAGIAIEKASGRRRKWFLVMSIAGNLGVLVVFKYGGFFTAQVNALLQVLHSPGSLPVWEIILPIGLSFHTFQAMSYTIEVYRGNYPAERHFGLYAVYVLFYPQLVAGPIERPAGLLRQLRERHVFDWGNLGVGLRLMLWGFFKKLVIADRLGGYVNYVYNNLDHLSSVYVVLAVVFFSFQIYCDFSGYSDIAIGAARTMGFRLVTNFDRPYFARNIREFWARWHISLTSWFRDYVYIPMGGNRVHWYRNILFVFLLSGLW